MIGALLAWLWDVVFGPEPVLPVANPASLVPRRPLLLTVAEADELAAADAEAQAANVPG